MTVSLVVTEHGGPEVLAVTDTPEPVPADGEVIVDVAAVGVNFIDVYQREGIYLLPTPFVACSEGAGTVRATGERVAWAMHTGSGASAIAIRTDDLVPVPDQVSLETAAAALLQGMTAHYLVNDTYAIRPGDLALVHAAAGGVGQLLVQLIVNRGGVVIATAGSQEKLNIARGLGAAHLIDTSEHEGEQSLTEAVRRASGGLGVHVAYDGVGAATFETSLASLRPRGMLALFGAASGQVPPIDLQRLNAAGSVFATRPSLAHHIATRAELLERAMAVFADVAAGRLAISIGSTWPLSHAAEAYRALEGRASTGKLLLIP